jgi:hypothetical protein
MRMKLLLRVDLRSKVMMSLRVLKRRKDLRRGMIDPLNHQTLRIMILSLLDLRSRSRKLLLMLLP